MLGRWGPQCPSALRPRDGLYKSPVYRGEDHRRGQVLTRPDAPRPHWPARVHNGSSLASSRFPPRAVPVSVGRPGWVGCGGLFGRCRRGVVWVLCALFAGCGAAGSRWSVGVGVAWGCVALLRRPGVVPVCPRPGSRGVGTGGCPRRRSGARWDVALGGLVANRSSPSPPASPLALPAFPRPSCPASPPLALALAPLPPSPFPPLSLPRSSPLGVGRGSSGRPGRGSFPLCTATVALSTVRPCTNPCRVHFRV